MKLSILSLVLSFLLSGYVYGQTKTDSLQLEKLDSLQEITHLQKSLAQKDSIIRLLRDSVQFHQTNFEYLIRHSTNVAWRIRFQNKLYEAYLIDIDANQVQLFNLDSTKKNYTFESIDNEQKTKQQQLVFAMNAGMFTPERKPLGMYVENGKLLQKVNTKKKGYGNFFALQPNGIFLIDSKNQAYIIPTEEHKNFPVKELKLATQSGPLMLNNGEMNSYFRKGSSNLHIRNGVGVINGYGVQKNKKLIFIISKQRVNFYEFTELFQQVFQCKYALYLDGAISKMYLPELKRFDSGRRLGPIITVIR